MPVAHAGHWLVQLSYFLPVVAFLVWLAVVQLKARREDASEGEGKDPDLR